MATGFEVNKVGRSGLERPIESALCPCLPLDDRSHSPSKIGLRSIDTGGIGFSIGSPHLLLSLSPKSIEFGHANIAEYLRLTG